MTPSDPYLYPGTEVLVNKLGIKDPDKLQEAEFCLFLKQICKPLPTGNFDYSHLKALHKHFLGELYDWAGEERTVDIIKGNSYFAHQAYIGSSVNKQLLQLEKENYLQQLDKEAFTKKAAAHFNELNAAHPFREGNGRTLRAFFDLLGKQAGYKLDWTNTTETEYLQASISGFNGSDTDMEIVFDKITIPFGTQREANQLLSEPAKKELQEYLQNLHDYREMATKAVRQFNKPDANAYKEFAKEAKAIYQQKAQSIIENQSLWDELSQNSKFSLAHLNTDHELQTVTDKLNSNQITAEEIGLIQTNIKGAVKSLSASKALGKGRHR